MTAGTQQTTKSKKDNAIQITNRKLNNN